MKIVYMGTADFGIPALQQLILSRFTICGIVTTPPRMKGRGLKMVDSPIAEYAYEHNLAPVLTPENLKDSDFISTLSKLEADLFVVIAYRILPEEVFGIPPLGTINVHASLLPKFRGPAPIHRAIEAGEKETGISIFQINKGIDTGRIICRKKLAIGEQETTPELYERMSSLGAEALIEACTSLQQGAVTYVEQDHTLASSAPKLSKEESLINWDSSATLLFNKIRAFKPFPGTKTSLDGKLLGIEWAVAVEGDSDKLCGHVCEVSTDWFEVQCRDSRLRILEVKPAGKKQMTVRAFLNGTKVEKGMILG